MDPLTGLLDRRSFEELLEDEVERATSSGKPLTLVVGHVDALRLVNDSQGRAAGDDVLRQVGHACQKWKRRSDHAARLGGEEIALLLPATDERAGHLLAERLRRAAHRAFGDARVPVSLSLGIAGLPAHAADGEELLRAAEHAVAAAKAAGGDRSVVYSDEPARADDREPAQSEEELQLASFVALAESLDIRDTGTSRHSQAVGRYAELIARELGLDEERVERVRLAGVLHDIGKVGISDTVVSKPGPLDAVEWQEMYTHPELGARLLPQPEFADLRAWILAHHERPDGLGYPRGLSGDEIPLEARILAVADAYEAMTAERVYRESLGADAARAELRAGADCQFDSAVVEAFLRALEAGRARRLRRVA